MFGHWLEIIGLLLVALLVFGPKRMVEMGSSLGKAFKEFRNSTKGINFSQMFSGADADEDTSSRITPITPVSPSSPHIVEGSIEQDTSTQQNDEAQQGSDTPLAHEEARE